MRGDVRGSNPEDAADLQSSVAQNRFDNLFYTKSDEKFTVRALLDEIFGDRRFERSMDVGPGAGHITEPLARRTSKLLLVEKSPEYQEILKQRFPDAEILIAPIEAIERPEKFDVILLAHVLYYHKADSWLGLLERLSGMLSDKGELVVLLNSDAGDWWRLLSAFSEDVRPHMTFDYIPLSELRKQLSGKFHVQSHPYRYQLWIEPDAWCDVLGKQILELKDEQMLRTLEHRFREFSNGFKRVDGSFVLDMRAEIMRLSR